MVLLSSNHWLLAVEKKKERVYISLETGELWPQSCSDACTYHHRRRRLSLFFLYIALPCHLRTQSRLTKHCGFAHTSIEEEKNRKAIFAYCHRTGCFPSTKYVRMSQHQIPLLFLSLSLFSRFNG